MKKDEKTFTRHKIETFNAKYWEAISGEKYKSLTDNELKQKIINMSFKKLFEKSNTFTMFNVDGKFQRFCNSEEANSYYSDKLNFLEKNLTSSFRMNGQ